jgi:general secretion pathway protein I
MTCRHNRGFTLIEVLVALVIVAVGMSAMMGALSSSAKTVVYVQDKTLAEWVALNQIANTRLQLGQGQVPPTGTTNGDLDYGNRSWHWRQDIVASQVPGIVQIHAKVRPKEVKGGDDDSWYVEVVGLAGTGVGLAGTSEALLSWDGTLAGGSGAGNVGTPAGGTTPGTTPGSTTTTPPGANNAPSTGAPTPTPAPNP